MKKSIILSILIMLCSIPVCNSQNLVPNWDFEGHTNCPISLNDLGVNDWFQPTTGTPDYFNACGSNQAQIPSLFTGYQPPLSGDGYMGFICFSQPSMDTNYREYISVALSDTLIAGQCYDFEMFVNLNYVSQNAIAEIGVHFSVTALSSGTSSPLSVIPQIVNTSGVISDTSAWTSISGSYMALGGESHITIGNFNDDANTTSQLVFPSTWNAYAYYFVENVSLSLTSLAECDNASLDKENILTSLNVYPNPFSETLTFISPIKSPCKLIVYDFALNIVSANNFTESINLDTRTFVSGMYLYKILNNGEVIKSGKLVKR